MTTRNTHDRIRDHRGHDLDTNAHLDGALSAPTSTASGQTIHQALTDLNLAIVRGATFTFEQMVAAVTWTVAHSLGRHPSVTVVDSGGTVVTGDVAYVDDNNLVITFSAAFSGTAYLN